MQNSLLLPKLHSSCLFHMPVPQSMPVPQVVPTASYSVPTNDNGVITHNVVYGNRLIGICHRYNIWRSPPRYATTKTIPPAQIYF